MAHARRVRALGGVALSPDATDIKALVSEVDTLIVAAARGPRALKRRLLDLQELARSYSPDAEGKAQLRRLIDQLQVAIFAVDEHGHCIAASEGLTTLTGYSRLQLLSRSVFEIGFVPGHVSDARWRGFLANRQSPGVTIDHDGRGRTSPFTRPASRRFSPAFMSPPSPPQTLPLRETNGQRDPLSPAKSPDILARVRDPGLTSAAASQFKFVVKEADVRQALRWKTAPVDDGGRVSNGAGQRCCSSVPRCTTITTSWQ